MAVTPKHADLVDLSNHQTQTIYWRRARAAGLKGAYHKATEGLGFIDKLYAVRRAQAAPRGIPFGAYHFARPAPGSAAPEARYFLKAATPKPGDLAPMLDLEDDGQMSRGELSAWVGEFVRIVRAATGVVPIIYTPFDLDSTFGARVWVARYNNANAAPRVPAPWTAWDIDQFSDGVYGVPNRINGMPFATDLNMLRNGLSVQQLLIPSPSTPPVHPPVQQGYRPSPGMIAAINRASDLARRRVNIGVGECGAQVRLTAGATKSLGGTATIKMQHVELRHARLWRHIPNGSIVWGGPGSHGYGHVAYKTLGSGPGHFDGQLLTPGGPTDPDHWVFMPNWAALRSGWSKDALIGWSPDIDGLRL